jgi:hypothetical protein
LLEPSHFCMLFILDSQPCVTTYRTLQ